MNNRTLLLHLVKIQPVEQFSYRFTVWESTIYVKAADKTEQKHRGSPWWMSVQLMGEEMSVQQCEKYLSAWSAVAWQCRWAGWCLRSLDSSTPPPCLCSFLAGTWLAEGHNRETHAGSKWRVQNLSALWGLNDIWPFGASSEDGMSKTEFYQTTSSPVNIVSFHNTPFSPLNQNCVAFK